MCQSGPGQWSDGLMEPPHPSRSPQALRSHLGAGQSSPTAPRGCPTPPSVHCRERQREHLSVSSPSLCPQNPSLHTSELSQSYLSSLPHPQLSCGAVGRLLPWRHWPMASFSCPAGEFYQIFRSFIDGDLCQSLRNFPGSSAGECIARRGTGPTDTGNEAKANCSLEPVGKNHSPSHGL